MYLQWVTGGPQDDELVFNMYIPFEQHRWIVYDNNRKKASAMDRKKPKKKPVTCKKTLTYTEQRKVKKTVRVL